ncbi:hypothetical protein KFK14_12785 [Sphingobium phenoxybenzoativorans]|uniref:Uncharacterized protein n=1 Tax=Sphingobium phenoxybenzoativorans TaxID=1592790 RepID=A0A975K3T4_9SPHN|nr:hypothetical protein [Sphingobium phenoxybenzoativorans]QUT04022.1 hypothetical protein KFK14_12785 [Sphingobium phenoxybenzoativorans]
MSLYEGSQPHEDAMSYHIERRSFGDLGPAMDMLRNEDVRDMIACAPCGKPAGEYCGHWHGQADMPVICVHRRMQAAKALRRERAA